MTSKTVEEIEEFKLLGNKLAANDTKTREKTVKALGRFLSKKSEMVRRLCFQCSVCFL